MNNILNIEKSTTRDYINSFNNTFYESNKSNKEFINLFQCNILKHLKKDFLSNKLHGYTFKSIESYNIIFTEDFKKEVIKLTINNYNKIKNTKNFLFLLNLITVLGISYLNFNENIITDVYLVYPDEIGSNLEKSYIINIVKTKPEMLKNFKQTDELCLEIVTQNGLVLEHVNNKTPNICLAAVTQNGLALKYVDNKTKDLCLVAVQSNGLALEFVDTDLFQEITIDDFILEIYNKNTNYNKLLEIIYNKPKLDNENKINKIDQFFKLYVRYLLSKEQKDNINKIIENSASIIKINNDTDYYHSFVLDASIKNPKEIFTSDRFIWFSDRFDQAFLHLFNNARTISNIDKNTLVRLYISKFKLEKEIKIIDSKSSVNNGIFADIIPSGSLLKIIDALKERHHYYILLTAPKDKLSYQPKQWYAKGEFANENNKFILVILNELNKFLLEENKVYGYSNKFDQKEIALVGRNNLISQMSIQISKYTRVIKKNGTEIIFPITYNKYYKEFNDEYITSYAKLDDISILCKGGYEFDGCMEMIDCMGKKGIISDSFRMYKKDKSQIFYQDFDNPDQEIEFKNLNFDEYWKNKYLKYKAKYLALKNKN